MASLSPLIQTKFRLPFTRSEIVTRPRLQARVIAGLRGPLTLVTAPAGFGKTTLLASCIAAHEGTAIWLSLDRDDNQIDRFLKYVIAALQETDQTIGYDAAQFIAASSQPEPEFILTTLINDLDVLGTEIVFVLDDYHVIHNQAVHAAVAFLIEHSPIAFHLVIASRSDPPLPLARLRARGQVVELRAGDLSFTENEAAQFLNETVQIDLDHQSIAELAQRTEGWIAGLQMAALAMRGRNDLQAFIQGFSGTNRYILDYLLEEVLSHQPPEIQQFLLHTSILERLSSPLCAAILATEDASHSTLTHLEQANLFIIPLDDERIWYRYHHLFADLLRARLQQMLSEDQVMTLHERAAEWYERNGFIYDAIYHASLTSNNEWIERLIEENYMEMMQRGESLSIRFWTGQLSRELVYSRPLLCIHEAMSRAWFGQIDEADVFLTEAEKHFHSTNPSPEVQFLMGYASYVRSRVESMRGDIHQSIQQGLTAQRYVPVRNQALHGGIGVMLGYAYFLDGDFPNAVKTLSETIQSGVAGRVINSTIGAYCVLARLYALQGQLERSYEIYQEARAFIINVGGVHRGAMSVVDVGIAEVLVERNALDTALTHLKQGLDNIQYWGKADDLALAYTTHARIQHIQGNINAAQATIEKAVQLIRSSGVFYEARQAVEVTQVKLWLAQGDHAAVRRWSKSHESSANDGGGFEKELSSITLARVYLAQGRYDDAIRLLSRLEVGANSGGRQGRRIQILALRALGLQEMHHSKQALDTLAQSLKLAEPEGYVRVFLDEGQPMQILMARWLSQAEDGPLRDYATGLLEQFGTESLLSTVADEDGLIEPLTSRELEVLHIMALGKTNQEIAEQLVVARGTVKAHTASIYCKLDVANRTEAVARARQLGILP